ncbi:hypothetical protein FM038_008505 [Shewanella eurypsychrophilus]|uniref:histidine kinase n=1 Tax=Shewanella eurypsychrophilus TaxID=2593656 RepID=A0ABX6VAG2_9GAMM|nr:MULTISPECIES: histidine kinase dimerization/phospho-acceptor domain-containing protein [Shewanella]QPG57477.2 hypothetical protein FM038_008505 [Shewanella eurypsychrophilus]
MFKFNKFNHVLTATFLIYTSLLCALYAYLLFHAVHEIENQAAHIYLQNVQSEVIEESRLIEEKFKAKESLADGDEAIVIISDMEMIAKLIQNFKQKRPQLSIHSLLEANIPSHLIMLSPGLHEYIPNNTHILVFSLPNRKIPLYLTYDETNASNLDKSMPDLIVILSSVALLICLLGFIVSILLGRKIAEPLKQLALDVDKEEPQLPLIGHCRTDEIGTLSRNFTSSIERSRHFLNREKQFSRHVSHELRTPVAIISNSLSLLKLESASDEAKETALNRIKHATSNMNSLIETFLLLGREQEPNSKIRISLRDAVFNELEKLNSSNKQPTLKPKVLIFNDGIIQSEAGLLGILINNLLRNALAYSACFVRVSLSNNQLIIDNDIAELDSVTSSRFGYGTEIITRIVESLGCQIVVDKTDVRYHVSIQFND